MSLRLINLLNRGIKALDNVPKIKILYKKSGIRKAEKYESSSDSGIVLVNNLSLTKPKIRDKILNITNDPVAYTRVEAGNNNFNFFTIIKVLYTILI